MAIRQRILKRWRHPLTRRVLIGAVWAVALFGLAIPAWQRALVNQREIETLETRLANLDRWTVAGLWLERSVARRQPQVSAAWDRLFPGQRNREALFLDLARVADRSGVEAFDLAELKYGGMLDADVWADGSAVAADEPGPGDSPPPPTDDVPALAPPRVEMDSYRVKASFSSDYAAAARFLGGLRSIDRALGLHSLVVRPVGHLIQVDVELDVYVSQTTES